MHCDDIFFPLEIEEPDTTMVLRVSPFLGVIGTQLSGRLVEGSKRFLTLGAQFKLQPKECVQVKRRGKE